jgi:histidine triad (HIT) family protein
MVNQNCSLCNLELIPNQRIVFENEHCLFLQMPQNVLVGSGLIVPKRHKETVFNLSKEEWEATQQMLLNVKEFLDREYKPDGYNVGWNCGEIGGQHIFHAHLHVIPRFKDEPLAGKGIRYAFKQQSNKRELG